MPLTRKTLQMPDVDSFFNIFFQLQRINKEQKIRIRKTERALQKAEVC